MSQPEMVEELKPYAEEFLAAAKRGDEAECRRIVESAGLTWEDHEPHEKYRIDDDHQSSQSSLETLPIA